MRRLRSSSTQLNSAIFILYIRASSTKRNVDQNVVSEYSHAPDVRDQVHDPKANFAGILQDLEVTAPIDFQ
jgi:hypothetical protein